jgi:hypothetical protein
MSVGRGLSRGRMPGYSGFRRGRAGVGKMGALANVQCNALAGARAPEGHAHCVIWANGVWVSAGSDELTVWDC